MGYGDLLIFTTTATPNTSGIAIIDLSSAGFLEIPVVTAIAVGADADSNVYISATSKTSVTVETRDGADITFHVTAISSTAKRHRPWMLPSH